MGAGCCKEEAIDFNGEIELSHFHLLRSVGKGAFGKVRVVQHKKTKEIYALKYINKAKCIRMRAVENIIQERRLLEEVEFSLICNLRYAFQDDENLFMVLDLMLGGDLRFHLERAGPIREDVVKFYIAELALALDALHSRKIIHRDLKPDNVLLDEHGHAHLTDFNIAVYFNPAKPLVSIAGSMAYMAPEVLLRKGYLASVDWWSLGVVMFELLFGKRPFRGKSNDLLTNSILRDPLPLPTNVNDLLCERDISKRLGCTSEGLDGFKKHPWFHDINWEKLVTKEAVPPFEPDSKRANFDATHELEELLMEDNPLKAKKRAQTTPETELSSEMQLMEDKFTVYDYSKVRRSHSLSRPGSGSSKSLLRTGSAGPGQDNKMGLSSTTLDGGALTARSSLGRLENMPVVSANGGGATAAKVTAAYRPESLSDIVGQDRFNPDEDQISIISMSEASNMNDNISGYQLQQEPSKANPPFISIEAQEKEQQESESTAATETTPSSNNTAATALEESQMLRQQPSRDRLASGPGVSSAYTDSTRPSSPSNSSSGSSTLSTPPTTYNNSPAPEKISNGGTSGTALFSTPDSGTSLSSIASAGPTAPPLLDSASILNTPPTVFANARSRGLKGRQPSLTSAKGGRAFELSSQALQERQYQQQSGGRHQRSPSSVMGRPMSAYTLSTAGSLHEGMGEFQETKSMTLAYQQSFRASIAGLDDLAGFASSVGSLDGPSLGFSG
ncbi:hypothetical protein BGZ99_001591 [Dissophora globulifera]|uniref:Uncharacterized protein n=1 Tax=Dissophora globulifera TaxID=979702 RepID=A0A9P6UWU5_9FUNG|nr:hypothetical protein BGZ99_001591 [Dissophora globulifera]